MPPVPHGAWFNEVAAFLGTAYLRNASAKGADALVPGLRQLGVEHNEVGVERPEFELDVVWVAEHDERSSVFLLHA